MLRVEISGYRITVSKAPSPALASPAEHLPAVDSCSSAGGLFFRARCLFFCSKPRPLPLAGLRAQCSLGFGLPLSEGSFTAKVSGQVPCVFAVPSLTFRCARVPIAGPLPCQRAASASLFGQQPSAPTEPPETAALSRVPLPSPLRVSEYPLQGPLRPRAEIVAEFPACPPELIATCRSLRGGLLSAEQRAIRAWTAGCWARAILQGEAEVPEVSASTGLANRHYCVLAAEGLDQPAVVGTFSQYKRMVGQLRRGGSVSQAFPSESECRLYFAGAGVPFPLQ